MPSPILTALATKVVAAGIVTASATTGVLAATDHLPAAAQQAVADAAAKVGLNLPDPAEHAAAAQDRGKSVARDVQDVIDGTPPSERGREFGAEVSEKASQNRQNGGAPDGVRQNGNAPGRQNPGGQNQGRTSDAETEGAVDTNEG